MYEKELNRIIDASRNNALTFFVGAGVSTISGAPKWSDLISAINLQMGKNTKNECTSDDLLRIPQMYYYSLGSNKTEYYRFITNELNPDRLKPNVIHREMFNLNPVSFITTNFDSLLEDFAIQRCQGFKVVAQDKDVPQLYGDRFILKIHGDLKNKNIVLKEEDYLNYSENFKLIETLTKSIFATNTVVFIGYGLNDYNIKLILNWVKTLLKSNFRRPIFIHTDNESLTKEDLLYQESKGLDVIDCTQISSVGSRYLERYQAFFNLIKTTSEKSLENKTEDEAFEILYNLLLPLDGLNSLRVEDVNSRLSSYVRISEDGVIHFSEGDCQILKKFLHINHLSGDERKHLDSKTIEQYQGILRVFKKSRINIITTTKNYEQITSESIPFADERCILFDYRYMYLFSKKQYQSDLENYRKAFYLSRLQRFGLFRIFVGQERKEKKVARVIEKE